MKNASGTCSTQKSLNSWIPFQVYNIMGKWASSFLSGLDSRVVQILLDSQRPRWVVEHHCCPRCLRSRQQLFREQGLFLDLVLDLCLSQPLSQRTFLLKGLVLHVLDVVLVSKLREHLFLYVHLQERTPDHHLRHPRRQGLPIAQFCFALALCAANFKPTITWKRNGTAIVVGDHSSVVKRFLFVKKVQLLQGCLCIPMASVTSRWERETAHLWAKISARTWTWTPQNDLIAEKNNSMQGFMRNLVAMRQTKTKLRCLKPHRPYTLDFTIDARERVNQQTHKRHNVVRSKVLIVRSRSILMQNTAKKVGLQGWKCDKSAWCAKTNLVTCDFFAYLFLYKLSWDKKLQNL